MKGVGGTLSEGGSPGEREMLAVVWWRWPSLGATKTVADAVGGHFGRREGGTGSWGRGWWCRGYGATIARRKTR